jgi:uncharacterized protein YcfJ
VAAIGLGVLPPCPGNQAQGLEPLVRGPELRRERSAYGTPDRRNSQSAASRPECARVVLRKHLTGGVSCELSCIATCTLPRQVICCRVAYRDERDRDMKRVAFTVAAVAGAISGAVLGAGPSSAAIPPAGVVCAGMTCANTTSAPQIVNGTAVCSTGVSLPVNVLLEPLTARRLNVACPDGAQPLGLSF